MIKPYQTIFYHIKPQFVWVNSHVLIVHDLFCHVLHLIRPSGRDDRERVGTGQQDPTRSEGRDVRGSPEMERCHCYWDIIGIVLGYGYGSIPINTILMGGEHPFTSYFDVHQGYKVLTHCHIFGI